MASTGLLTVNLDAIASNWTLIRDLIKDKNSNVECGAVVKADAYGLGMLQVATALKTVGCFRFFVATLKEAIELRQILVNDESIVVLSGLSHGLSDDWLTYKLMPVLFDQGHISQWSDYCKKHQKKLPCALKVNTGMNRLGMEPGELNQFIGSSSVENIAPEILMSHLACADDRGHELNEQQLKIFFSISRKVKKIYPNIKLSLANSAGSFLGADYRFDICRPGASLYGVNPTPHANNPMNPVVKLALPIIQQRLVAKGEAVGYGATFLASRETRLAVVFGGYADGLFRLLSNRGYGWCNGAKVPIVGRVSMDSMVFDITDIKVKPKTIELLNEFQGVDELAQYTETIGYEVLTNLGERYVRNYVSTNLGVQS